MSYLPAEVKSNLSALSCHLNTLEQQLEVLLAQQTLQTLSAELPKADALKVNTAMAYSLYAMYYTLLRVEGQDTTEHPVKDEFERVRQYADRVTKALASDPQGAVSTTTSLETQKGPPQMGGQKHWKEDLGKILSRSQS
jgi:hypothetical protein